MFQAAFDFTRRVVGAEVHATDDTDGIFGTLMVMICDDPKKYNEHELVKNMPFALF